MGYRKNSTEGMKSPNQAIIRITIHFYLDFVFYKWRISIRTTVSSINYSYKYKPINDNKYKLKKDQKRYVSNNIFFQ